ncbi:MAG: hypothetical protein K0V04_22885 [Deltaproteobacteria bacterium]|nr:hypothetical protein [Deltaproteobacteria bacterium]
MSNTIIKVQYNSSNVVQWQKRGASSWTDLSTTPGSAPTIAVRSSTTVVFQFNKESSSQSIVFKPSSGGDETSLSTSGSTPNVSVTSGNTQQVYLAKDQTTKVWYTGFVEVTDDGLDIAP